MKPVLDVESVVASYGKRPVLNGINFSIRPGEIVAILGANGAGKSTLLKVIIGLVPTAAGRIRLNAREIHSLSAHYRRRLGIGYLPQRDDVFPSLTTIENLQLGTWGVHRAERTSAIARTLEEFPSLRDNLRRRAGLLSGGQRRLLALAATMLVPPKVLLLDEPSAGLAPSAAEDIFGHVDALVRKNAIPVIWAEQRVADILNRADRALLFRRGIVATETSTPRQWLNADLWGPEGLGANP